MLVIAHRGANREALENSWSAFELAIAGGAARIELDVQLSADGHAVVIHDDRIDRTTGIYAKVSQLSRPELAKIKLLNGEGIPFLDEVIERILPRCELNIEIKGPNEDLARVTRDLLAHHQRREAVIISSFNFEPLVWLSQHAPGLQRACLWSRDTFSWPFFANLAPNVFLDRVRTNILHPYVELVDEHLMDQAIARGWKVYAWAAMADEEQDREGLWSALKTFGLHGLCTNYPRQLKSWLHEASLDEQSFGSKSHSP